MYGGDYYKYATKIKKYFSSYLECNIKPILIFDGGYDKSDRKFQTTLMRSRTRLTVTQHIAKHGDCSGKVLPICAKTTFRDVLSELGIQFAQCDFEADDQVTALANYYDCPALSDDSDFYIFNVRKGFIRLASVGKSVLEADIDGTKCKYLDCNIYHVDKFMSYFPALDQNVLPLFGTLVGNDYVNTKEFESFYGSIRIGKRDCRGFRANQGQKKIVRLLTWLEHCNVNEAVEKVLRHLNKKNREHVEFVMNQSMDIYKTQNSILKFVIDNELDQFKKILQQDPKLKTPCGQSLPIPFLIAFHLGNLPGFFINIINLHRTFLLAQVENVSLPSSYACSRYIRQVIYGILLQHTADDEKTHKEVCLQNVNEYDRRSGHGSRESVVPVFSLKNGTAVPKLNNLYCLEKSHLQQFLLDVLEVDMDFISIVPNSLQLLFSCIIYWLKNCAPAPKDNFVFALLLNIIYFQIILKKSSKQKMCTSSKNECWEELSFQSLISNVSIEDADLAAQNMKKYLQKPAMSRGNPLILHIVHSFSQLQTCMLYISYLNSLFNFPFENPKLHEAYAGSMLYNLTKDLSTRPFPDLFISELLGRGSNLNIFFNILLKKLLGNIETDSIELTDRSSLQKRKEETKKNLKRKKASKVVKENIETPCNQFENINSLEEGMTIDNLGEIYI
ncbi:protein asteroid homolog 1 [Nephila pilipes]|uniref:Protein asteroid homolog 1 n=1 Tax=Nephila pilipes TaxID=299642 RepID=A0A8X6NRU3_NEPPI|nr:protein asteroid homolog 1 [Nephila pilipes]